MLPLSMIGCEHESSDKTTLALPACCLFSEETGVTEQR
jgi:hypothetical protein